jgi:hypothetical protein
LRRLGDGPTFNTRNPAHYEVGEEEEEEAGEVESLRYPKINCGEEERWREKRRRGGEAEEVEVPQDIKWQQRKRRRGEKE